MAPPNRSDERSKILPKLYPDRGASRNRAATSGLSRKRVSQACNKCRHRKDKCDGRKPNCSACVKRNQVCSYDSSIKKRGLPEGYVRDLECNAQRLEGYAGDLELICSVLLQQISEHYEGLLMPDTTKIRRLKDAISKAWNNDEMAEGLRNTWREGDIFKELSRRNRGIEGLGSNVFERKRAEEDKIEAGDGSEDVDSGTESGFLVDESVGEGEKGRKESSQRDIPDSQRFHNTQGPSLYHSPLSSNASPELPPRAWHLLDIYFTHTHSWLPIVEKHDVLRTYHNYSSKGLKACIGREMSGSQALLWAILAFAAVQYTSITAPTTADSTEELYSTEDLYKYARSLIPEEDGLFEIGHVQSLLIISLLKLGNNKLQAAWILSGQAVRIAFQLGLNQQSDAGRMRERHVFLGCFTVDTLISARLRRPAHLTADDIDYIGNRIDESGLEEWDTWSDALGSKIQPPSAPRPPLICSTFNKLIISLRSLNMVLREISTKTPNFDPRAIINALHATHNDKNSPEQLSLTWSQQTVLLPHHFNLHLAYLTVTMTCLLRRHEICYDDDETEANISSLFQIVSQTSHVLTRFDDSFGLAIAPPITEFFLSVFQDSCILLESLPRVHAPAISKNWRSNLQKYVSNLFWPIYENLQNTLPEDTVNGREPSEIVPQHDQRSAAHMNPDSRFARQSLSVTAGGSTEETNKSSGDQLVTSIFEPPDGFPRLYSDSSNTPQSSSMTHSSTTTLAIQNLAEPAAYDFEMGSNSILVTDPASDSISTLMQELPKNADRDVLNEFAILDAMEWTGTYDQSLLNLGFTSSEIMSQDFYELYQDSALDN